MIKWKSLDTILFVILHQSLLLKTILLKPIPPKDIRILRTENYVHKKTIYRGSTLSESLEEWDPWLSNPIKEPQEHKDLVRS